MENILYTVKQVSDELGVNEETVRRWIRSRSLRAYKDRNEFLISPWHLDTFLLTGGESYYEDSDMITTASLGVNNALDGAFLFDHAYFEVEKQWERILEDKVLLTKKLKKEKDGLLISRGMTIELSKKIDKAKSRKEIYQLISKNVGNQHSYIRWSVIQRTLFLDYHFYFVAADDLGRAVDILKSDINKKEFNEIIDRYDCYLKDLNDCRNNLEHIEKEINSSGNKGDLGNLWGDKFSFGGKYYLPYITELRDLKNEICDYFLKQKLPDVKGNVKR